MSSQTTDKKIDPRNLRPQWKQELAGPIATAVYNAAVGLGDEEIEGIVRYAIFRARRERPGYNASPGDWLRYSEHLEAEVERLHSYALRLENRLERLETHYENHASDDYGTWLQEEIKQ